MPSLPTDTRGILAPVQMMQRVAFHRYPAPEPLQGLVDWFWSVHWALPAGVTHRQWVLPSPGVNLSVGVAPPPGPDPPPGPFPLGVKINGVSTTRSCRALRDTGWNVAAKSTIGGFGAWLDDVAKITEQVIDTDLLTTDQAARCADLVPVLPAVESLALREDTNRGEGVAGAAAMHESVAVVAEALIAELDQRPQARVRQAREVAEIGALIETDRGLRRVEQVAALVGVTTRTLQRQFSSCAGVGPAYVIRRSRLLEAAERVREGTRVDWAEVAADLGYADQAHLTRDFTSTLGQSPASYARSCRPAAGT